MTNANSFHSAVFVLLIAGAVYFIALGIHELKKLIIKAIHRKEE